MVTVGSARLGKDLWVWSDILSTVLPCISVFRTLTSCCLYCASCFHKHPPGGRAPLLCSVPVFHTSSRLKAVAPLFWVSSEVFCSWSLSLYFCCLLILFPRMEFWWGRGVILNWTLGLLESVVWLYIFIKIFHFIQIWECASYTRTVPYCSSWCLKKTSIYLILSAPSCSWFCVYVSLISLRLLGESALSFVPFRLNCRLGLKKKI